MATLLKIKLVISFIIFILLFQFLIVQDLQSTHATIILNINYIEHDPIIINGDAEFEDIAQEEGWSGDGSFQNPFIIENLQIEGELIGNQIVQDVEALIILRNTNHNFIIRNCHLSNGMNGILIDSSVNGEILSNVILNDLQGIEIINSVEIEIDNNQQKQEYFLVLIRFLID